MGWLANNAHAAGAGRKAGVNPEVNRGIVATGADWRRRIVSIGRSKCFLAAAGIATAVCRAECPLGAIRDDIR